MEEAGGAISCERFMELALHDPDHGYYARRIRGIGGRGDFTTAAALSPALAKAIANWLLEKHRATGIRQVIEFGPGNGDLAFAVRGALPWLARRRLRFHFVESSQPLAAIQQQRLGTRGLSWHTDAPTALAAAGGRALLYSNEFLDAFPARRFRMTAQGWRELGVTTGPDGNLVETVLPGELTEQDLATLPSPVADGFIIERHDSVGRWLTALAGAWKSGAMLTIDYGHASPLPDPRRPRGTLRAYLLQQRLEGDSVYQNPGRQDITADVDFHALRQHGETLGWATESLCDQTTFLRPFADSSHPGDRMASDPLGAGSAFLVLAQSHGS